MWAELPLVQRVEWLSLKCNTGRDLLEPQLVHTLVKSQWKTCNELQSFHWLKVLVGECVLSLLSLPPVSLLKLSSGWHPSLPSALHWLLVIQHSQRCPWHHSVPLPHSSYGYLSLLIPIQFPDYFRAVGDWSRNPQARGLAGLLLCMVWGLECSNFHWNRAWKLQYKPENLFALSSLMGLNADHLKACFISLPWISVLPQMLFSY